LECEGCTYPPGTDFVVNEIAVSADCENPDVFKPERWLNGNDANVPQRILAFGGARRVSVGYKIA
jgi:cytochrome P450